MKSKSNLPELRELSSWLGKTIPHPKQTHGLGESDAEIVRIAKNQYLATTVDAIAEEIAYGLYPAPFTMGWMTATAALSDLAAVGAEPTGILFSSQWKWGTGNEFKTRVAEGLKKALAQQKTYLLGGDTGSSAETVLTGTAIGLLKKKPLSRLGIRAGDHLFLSGKIGIGPAFAFERVLGGSTLTENDYRPKARLDLGKRLLGIASAMMDTSDGVAMSLHTLSTLNQVGIEFVYDTNLFDEAAIASVQAMNLPVSSLLFGEHGDFQLLFSVPEKNLNAFRRLKANCFEIGVAVKGKHSAIIAGERKIPCRWDLTQDLPKNSLSDFKETILTLGSWLRALGLS